MHTHYSQRGFGLAEIVVSLAIFLIVMVAVFQYSAVLYTGSYAATSGPIETIFPHGLDIFRYGEKVCDINTQIQMRETVDLSATISTSTPITSIHAVEENVFILTTDSASTTEPDVFKIRINGNNAELIESKDTGPGVQDSVLLYPFLYIANTSVNSHVKVLQIDSSFTELQNGRIGSLSLSGAMPRTISVFGHNLIFGAEKNNAGGELFVMPVLEDGLLGPTEMVLELGGQAHESRVFGMNLLTANSADPELRVFNHELNQINEYDAPLTLGNGKSILNMYPYVIFGRTLGTGELTLLDFSSSTIQAVDTDRTNGTVDDLQQVGTATFFTLTSNSQKEIQFWDIENNRFSFLDSIDIPARSTAYQCADNTLYVAMLVNDKPIIVILN